MVRRRVRRRVVEEGSIFFWCVVGRVWVEMAGCADGGFGADKFGWERVDRCCALCDGRRAGEMTLCCQGQRRGRRTRGRRQACVLVGKQNSSLILV